MRAALVAGCGNGSSAPTKSEFIATATPICKSAEQMVKRAEGGSQKLFLETFANAAHTAQSDLSKLELPAQDAGLIQAYTSDLGRVADDFDQAVAALKKGDKSTAKAKAQAAFTLFQKTSKNTREFGFPKGVCGSGES